MRFISEKTLIKRFTAVINACCISISDPVEFVSKSSPNRICFWSVESGWIAIRRPDHVQHWSCAPLQQRLPESLFQTPTSILIQRFWIWVRIRVQLFFEFENLTPVQIPATIIELTVIYPCFYQRNDRTESCYCRNGKVTTDPGPVFHKFLTPGPKEKCRILPESTPVTGFGPISALQEISGVGIWKFCNPDPIRDFFINSTCNPYPKVKNYGLRYPIQIRNCSLSCTLACIFSIVYFASSGKSWAVAILP